MGNMTLKIFNATASALSNVNAAGDDVPAGQSRTAVLTEVEIETLLGTAGVFVAKSTTTEAERSRAGTIVPAGYDPGAITVAGDVALCV